MEKKIFTISNIQQEGGQIKVFTLSPDDGKNLVFKPGQFVQLYQLENNAFGKLARPYSIASSPTNPNLHFVIKITGGQFTSLLDKMKVGDKLGVVGPFGHFTYEGEDKVVCIAAGIGVAPMVGILEHIAHHKIRGKFTLFYSARTRADIACSSLLQKLQTENPGIKVVYTLTREQPEGWQGELGRLTAAMISKYVDYLPQATVFICGSIEFAKTMKEIVLSLGADPQKVKVEAWGL